MQKNFQGIWVPVVTPFRDNRIDREALSRLAIHLVENEVAGLVAGATAGEGALLRAGEHEELVATLRGAVPGTPLVLGLSQSSTDSAVTQARELAALGVDGILATPPSYLRPSQDGIQKHFEAIVEAADLPIIIYNIPYRTGVTVELNTLKRLSLDARVVGIKECGGSNERMLRLVHETPLCVLSGDDSENFSAFCLGAHGAIATSGHILPHLHVRMLHLVRAGQLAEARSIAVALQPLIRGLFSEPNPAPLKSLLAALGWCSPNVRLPFVEAREELVKQLMTDHDTLRRFAS